MIISASMALSYALKLRNTGKKEFHVATFVVVSVLEKGIIHMLFGHNIFLFILGIICTIVSVESMFYIEPVKSRFDIFIIYIVFFLMIC